MIIVIEGEDLFNNKRLLGMVRDIRKQVFVEELEVDNVPLDEYDRKSTHFLILSSSLSSSSGIEAYARLLPKGEWSLKNVLSLPINSNNFRELSRVTVVCHKGRLLMLIFKEMFRYFRENEIEYLVANPLADGTWGHFGSFKSVINYITPSPIEIRAQSGKRVRTRPFYIVIKEISFL